jgi:hypothetical protein
MTSKGRRKRQCKKQQRSEIEHKSCREEEEEEEEGRLKDERWNCSADDCDKRNNNRKHD